MRLAHRQREARGEKLAAEGRPIRAHMINDEKAAALLATRALTEIRYLAWRVASGEEKPSKELFDRIRFLADLAHNMPGIARRLSGTRAKRDRQQMQWVWSTAGAEGRSWMLESVHDAGYSWTPPPETQPPERGANRLPLWRNATALIGFWPVRTPIGRQRLPATARVLKALTTPEIVAVHDAASDQRLGLGGSSPWLAAHLDPNGRHYLVPDPAPYYWPGPDRRWWQCRELLRMVDGTQVTSSVAVLPERFAALPDTLSRRQQRFLVHVMRGTWYDLHQWGQDHTAKFGSASDGYRSKEPTD
jgi:hypothetical protein